MKKLFFLFFLMTQTIFAQNNLEISNLNPLAHTPNIQVNNETPRFIFLWYQNDDKSFKFDLGWRHFQWRENERFTNANEVSLLLRFQFK